MEIFEKELCSLLNKYSKENGSNTPDFILAEYLIACIENFDKTITKRSHHIRGDDKNNVSHS